MAGQGRIVKKESERRIPTSPGRLLTLKQAAQYLGLTTWAMRERIWQGLIPAVRFPGGRKQYIDTQDIEKFIEENKKVWD